MNFWKLNQSLFLIRTWIPRMAYNRIHTWSYSWSCKSLWNDLGSVAFIGWMEPCFFWALFCVGFIIKCLLLSKSFSNTKDSFCLWDISRCQKSLMRSLKVWKSVCVYFKGSKMKEMSKRNPGRARTWRTLYLRATVMLGHGMHHCCLLTGSLWRDTN